MLNEAESGDEPVDAPYPPRTPRLGELVHYVAYGTPGGEYESTCRAALVAGLVDAADPRYLHLGVLHPQGMFFNVVVYDTDETAGGSWHLPNGRTGCKR